MKFSVHCLPISYSLCWPKLIQKYRIGHNKRLASIFCRFVEVFAVFLENCCILFKNIVNIHSRSPANTSQENYQICILEGLLFIVWIEDLYVWNIAIAAILKLKFKDFELIFFNGDFEKSELNINVIAEDVAFAKIVIKWVGDVTASTCNTDDHRAFSHLYLYMFSIY